MNSMIHIVTSTAPGETAEMVQAFADDLCKCCTAQQVILLDGQSELDALATLETHPTVLLNADRADIMGLLTRSPLAAAVEKYALFAWWRKRGKSSGAFWLHGSVQVVRRMGPDIQVSGLYSTESHCAFGSASHRGLPELLAAYLESAMDK